MCRHFFRTTMRKRSCRSERGFCALTHRRSWMRHLPAGQWYPLRMEATVRRTLEDNCSDSDNFRVSTSSVCRRGREPEFGHSGNPPTSGTTNQQLGRLAQDFAKKWQSAYIVWRPRMAMKQEDSRRAVLTEYDRWAKQHPNQASMMGGFLFFRYLQVERSDLLEFRAAGSKWPIVHGWIRDSVEKIS